MWMTVCVCNVAHTQLKKVKSEVHKFDSKYALFLFGLKPTPVFLLWTNIFIATMTDVYQDIHRFLNFSRGKNNKSC